MIERGMAFASARQMPSSTGLWLRPASACTLAMVLAGCGSGDGGGNEDGGGGSTGTSPDTTTGTTNPTTTASVGTTGGPICGWESGPCCDGSAPCMDDGFVCIEGTCAPPRAFGEPCTEDTHCSSNLCLDSGHCSQACTTEGDCPPAPEWSCATLDGYPSLMCQCTSSGPDACDGHDNDCDGTVDDGATCEEPGFTCQAGACACAPSNWCDGVCKDLASDPENCGACGAVCDASATCVGGHCLTTLASGQDKPADLVLRGGSIYWTNNPEGTIRSVSIDGGVPVTLASNQLHPTHLTIDATHVYWTTGGDLQNGPGSVMKVPLEGGAPITLATPTLPWAIAVDATHVYWTGSDPNAAVLKLPLDGGATTTLAGAPSSPWALTVDDSGVYWTEYGGVRKVAKAGGTVTTLVEVDIMQVDDIATDATTVYFTTHSAVMKVAKAGGAVTTLAEQGFPRGIAVDASHVYWADQDNGFIFRVPLDGGSIDTVASDQFAPFDVVVDATSVYWNTFSGNIMKASK